MKYANNKRVIACILLLCLLPALFGCFDGSADPTHTSEVPTTQPAESVTDSTKPTTQPTEPATQPTQPTEPVTPPTQPTEPETPTTQPTETQPVQTEPATQPTKPAPTLPPATDPVAPQPDHATGDKVIYLTFDDGPGYYTPELLTVLEKYNVKATFFVVGTAYLEYLDDIAQAGHAIGIHTNSHVYENIYSSTDAFWKDFYAMDDKIFQAIGIHTKLYRFPGGSSNSISKKICPGIMTKLSQQVQDQGYYYFDWNVDSNDAGGAKTPGEVYQNVISGVKGKRSAVVLMHDIRKYTVDAIESILRWGLQNGYVFLPLDESSPEVHHTLRN